MEMLLIILVIAIPLVWFIVNRSDVKQSISTRKYTEKGLRFDNAYELSRDLYKHVKCLGYGNTRLRDLMEWVDTLDDYNFSKNNNLNSLTIKVIEYVNFINLHSDIKDMIIKDLNDSLVTHYLYPSLGEGPRFTTSVDLSKWIDDPTSMNKSINLAINNIERVINKYSHYKASQDAWKGVPVAVEYNNVFVDMNTSNIPELQELQKEYLTLMKKLNKPNYMLEAAIEKFTMVDFVRADVEAIDIAIKALRGKINSLMNDKDFHDDIALQVIPQMLNYSKTSLD